MPIKSEQQRKFMAMCLHNPEKAQGKCPPKSVAKKFIHGHSRKDETSDMNNQIDHRLALKILFEAALIKQAQEGKLDEGFFGDIGARLTGRPTSSDRIRNVVNQSRMKRAAKKDTGGTQPNVPITSKITSPVQQIQKLRAARQGTQPATQTAAPKQNPATEQKPSGASYGDIMKSIIAKRKTSKQIAPMVSQMNKAKALAAARRQNQPQPQNSSTNYSRLGLRALFEAVIVESKKKVVTETGILMTPEKVKDKSLPSKFKRLRLALTKIGKEGEGEEGKPGPSGAVATVAAALRRKGAGKPTGRGEGTDEGNPLRGEES